MLSLELHSRYSLFKATPSIDQIVARAADEGLSTLALTDTAALFGAVQFQQACAQVEIRPILGMVAPLAVDQSLAVEDSRPDELVLLAMNGEGYRSLSALATLYQADPERERFVTLGLPWEKFAAFTNGLICITGVRGRLTTMLRQQQEQAAARYLSRLAPLFPERGFVGLDLPGDETHHLIAVGGRFGLPPVAIPPVYLLDPAEKPLLRLLSAIQQNVTIGAVPPQTLPTADTPAVWRSPEQLKRDFAEFPEALTQVQAITDRCTWGLPDGRPLWPVLKLPVDQTADHALGEMAAAGLKTLFSDEDPSAEARLKKELKLIAQHGYAPLFLILADVVRFAREQKIPVNTRGSVANSLVAYAVGITNVDPIAHALLFERFLNPERRELPDIDLDFCSRRRDEVLAYVRDRYGEDRVALVSTINTLQNRSAVREVAKAHGLSAAEIKTLTENLPRFWHPDPRRRISDTMRGSLAKILAAHPEWSIVVEQAEALVGYPSHLGLHPGGVVIAPPPAMTAVCPLHYSPKGYLATQFDFRDVEVLGLVKVDLLGIRALSVIDQAARLIRERHNPDFEIDQIPFDDASTSDLLQRGETIGCFQVESTGAIRTLRQLRARTVRDLAMANAFFKPGPATGGMAAAFIRRYRGEEDAAYLHPTLEPILHNTKGVLIFQEQVLRIVTEIAGLSWSEANQIRKGISKFKSRQVRALKDKFIAQAQAHSKLSAEQAETLWIQVEAFSGYGFNQGHATSYGLPTYQMAWLKVHYPAEFFCARLAEHGGYHHPAVYIAEARRLGLTIRPPHVNYSRSRFAMREKDENERPILWMGLGQVRDLRRSSIMEIVRRRETGPFTSARDLLQRVSLQEKEIDHLVRCGALDGLGASRQALLAEVKDMQRTGSANQLNLFGQTMMRVPEAEPFVQQLRWERELLGWPMSGHPAALMTRQGADLPLREIPLTGGERVQGVGVKVPGFTGGRGFYLDDGRGMILVRDGLKRPLRSWRPVRVFGRWQIDEWGGGFLELDEFSDNT